MAQVRQSSTSRNLVAAIDLGTTYSGYAFSFKSEWPKVQINNWQGGQLSSFKAPTALLLNPDKSFNSFGFEAEDKYAEIADDHQDKEYYFFRRFKMVLHSTKKLHRETMCRDENEREIEVMRIFTYSIRYLKDHLLETVNGCCYVNVGVDDIDFVLTVPAIWDDSAKMFIREAAVKAGLPDKQLQMVLEPEAASIYCQLMQFDDAQQERGTAVWTREPGMKYMIVDLGGGVADVTVLQLQEKGTWVKVVEQSGGPWGGTSVDEAYWSFLMDIFGRDVMMTFKYEKEYSTDCLEFWQNFEVKKREAFKSKSSDKVHLRIPIALFDIIREKRNKRGPQHSVIKELIDKSKHRNENITSKPEKLVLPIDFFKKLFTPTIEKIANHLSQIFEGGLGSEVDVILLVGGFSECDLVQDNLRQRFGNKKFVIPEEAGVAVLKGAVFAGHHKDMVSFS